MSNNENSFDYQGGIAYTQEQPITRQQKEQQQQQQQQQKQQQNRINKSMQRLDSEIFDTFEKFFIKIS